MNAPVSHATLINPFALPPQATLAEVAERVSSSTLSPTRKRDCLSALRRVGHLLDQDLSSIGQVPISRRGELCLPQAICLTSKEQGLIWPTARGLPS